MYTAEANPPGAAGLVLENEGVEAQDYQLFVDFLFSSLRCPSIRSQDVSSGGRTEGWNDASRFGSYYELSSC